MKPPISALLLTIAAMLCRYEGLLLAMAVTVALGYHWYVRARVRRLRPYLLLAVGFLVTFARSMPVLSEELTSSCSPL